MLAYTFDGRRYDCGSKLGYLQATVELGVAAPRGRRRFPAFLRPSSSADAPDAGSHRRQRAGQAGRACESIRRESRGGRPGASRRARCQFGELAGTPVVFLARHGYGHTIAPQDINYRANICGAEAGRRRRRAGGGHRRRHRARTWRRGRWSSRTSSSTTPPAAPAPTTAGPTSRWSTSTSPHPYDAGAARAAAGRRPGRGRAGGRRRLLRLHARARGWRPRPRSGAWRVTAATWSA